MCCCSCNFLPKFLKFWTLLVDFILPGFIGFLNSIVPLLQFWIFLSLNWVQLFTTFEGWMIIFCLQMILTVKFEIFDLWIDFLYRCRRSFEQWIGIVVLYAAAIAEGKLRMSRWTVMFFADGFYLLCLFFQNFWLSTFSIFSRSKH